MLIHSLRLYFESLIYDKFPDLSPRFSRIELDFQGSIGQYHEYTVKVIDTRIDKTIYSVITESVGNRLVRYSTCDNDYCNSDQSTTLFMDNSPNTVVVSPELLESIKYQDISLMDTALDCQDWLITANPTDEDLLAEEAWLSEMLTATYNTP